MPDVGNNTYDYVNRRATKEYVSYNYIKKYEDHPWALTNIRHMFDLINKISNPCFVHYGPKRLMLLINCGFSGGQLEKHGLNFSNADLYTLEPQEINHIYNFNNGPCIIQFLCDGLYRPMCQVFAMKNVYFTTESPYSIDIKLANMESYDD